MKETDGFPEDASTDWDAVIEDATALAAEYRDRSWEAIVVHTGDVTVLTGEQFGLSVLAPTSEYEQVKALVGRATFDSVEVYRRAGKDWIFALCVFEATAAESAVLVPVFAPTTAPELRAQVDEAGELPIYVRSLAEDERTTFTVPDPSLVFES